MAEGLGSPVRQFATQEAAYVAMSQRPLWPKESWVIMIFPHPSGSGYAGGVFAGLRFLGDKYARLIGPYMLREDKSIV